MHFFSKLRRDAQRVQEIDPRVPAGEVSIVAGIVSAIATLTLAALLIPEAFAVAAVLVPLTAVSAAGAGLATFARITKQSMRLSAPDVTTGNFRLVGKPEDLGMVFGSLSSIGKLTKNFNASAALPEKVRGRVAAFIKDMEPAASRIVAFNVAEGNKLLPHITVTRDVISPDGEYRKEELGRVTTGSVPAAPLASKGG